MSCTAPVRLYRSLKGVNAATGKVPLVSAKSNSAGNLQLVPCGRCLHCLLERSRQWAVRCEKELLMHEKSCFLTLTYRTEELVYGFEKPTLYPRHLQLFLKRLRKKYGKGIRFFACGEYGERNGRPHYHAIIFGHDFADKTLCGSSRDNNYYNSSSLNDIWSHGDCIIGDATFESAAYVARYVVEKKYGQNAGYYRLNSLHPEFVRMSRRPGIGALFYDKFKVDVFPHDYVVIRGGLKCMPPRFFSLKYSLENPDKYSYILDRRIQEAEKNAEYSTKRLEVKDRVKKAQVSSLRRSIH